MERLPMVINVCPLWKYVTEAVYFSYFGAILVQFVASGHMFGHLSVAKAVMCFKGQQPTYQPYTVAMVTALYSGC